MPDRLLFPLMGLAAVLMIALALVWPQGLGARSPAPFGHAMVQKNPAASTPAGSDLPPGMLSLGPVTPKPAATPPGAPR